MNLEEFLEGQEIANWQALAMLFFMVVMLVWVIQTRNEVASFSANFSNFSMERAKALCDFKEGLIYSQQAPAAFFNWTFKNQTVDDVGD